MEDQRLFRTSLLAPRLDDEIMFPRKIYLVIRKAQKRRLERKTVQVTPRISSEWKWGERRPSTKIYRAADLNMTWWPVTWNVNIAWKWMWALYILNGPDISRSVLPKCHTWHITALWFSFNLCLHVFQGFNKTTTNVQFWDLGNVQRKVARLSHGNSRFRKIPPASNTNCYLTWVSTIKHLSVE